MQKKEEKKMSVSIYEALWNANYNLRNNGMIGLALAKDQLNNAVVLLEKGYELHEEVEPLLEKYGDVKSVPEREPK